MMSEFVVRYIPGGMSLNHSAWWLCKTAEFRDGTVHDVPIRMLRLSDYR